MWRNTSSSAVRRKAVEDEEEMPKLKSRSSKKGKKKKKKGRSRKQAPKGTRGIVIRTTRIVSDLPGKGAVGLPDFVRRATRPRNVTGSLPGDVGVDFPDDSLTGDVGVDFPDQPTRPNKSKA